MFQRLQQTRTQIEADLLISRLRAAGLHPADLRIWPNVMLAGAELFYSVDVPTEEIESASQIIQVADSGGVTVGHDDPPGIGIRLAFAIILTGLAFGLVIP